MEAITAEVTTKGKSARVPAVSIGTRSVLSQGTWLKTAQIFDELWLDAPPLEDPEEFIGALKRTGLSADLFTFGQMLPETKPKYSYHLEWDNLAVSPTSDFESWWTALPQESRKNVRKSQKRGVSVTTVDFGDELVHGIKAIYDETPVRQGRRFWHYGKDLETVRQQNSSYLDRSQFIGAFLDRELIGFLKMVYVGPTARIMQILSMNRHLDKHTTNALLATAVECCSKRPVSHLIYGQYVYGNKRNSSVTEFKRRNGFHEVLLPRYYLPLTWKGKLALSTGLHRGISDVLPEPLINFLLDTRSFVYDRLLRLRSSRAVANDS
ncbi:MAG TPA: hypothetical protein VFD66_03185 [Verrucomicrobiae bacterium]|nr:hypothetical protein [Verrucomicrobiae bacterium]